MRGAVAALVLLLALTLPASATLGESGIPIAALDGWDSSRSLLITVGDSSELERYAYLCQSVIGTDWETYDEELPVDWRVEDVDVSAPGDEVLTGIVGPAPEGYRLPEELAVLTVPVHVREPDSLELFVTRWSNYSINLEWAAPLVHPEIFWSDSPDGELQPCPEDVAVDNQMFVRLSRFPEERQGKDYYFRLRFGDRWSDELCIRDDGGRVLSHTMGGDRDGGDRDDQELPPMTVGQSGEGSGETSTTVGQSGEGSGETSTTVSGERLRRTGELLVEKEDIAVELAPELIGELDLADGELLTVTVEREEETFTVDVARGGEPVESLPGTAVYIPAPGGPVTVPIDEPGTYPLPGPPPETGETGLSPAIPAAALGLIVAAVALWLRRKR